MDLVKWEPFRDLVNLQQSINKLFEESILQWPKRAGVFATAWSFPVDVKETADSVVVKAELPGMEKDDIKVHFVNNQLTIQGERKQEAREEGERFLKIERSYGSFYRAFTLDVPVKADEIKANYKNGVLEIIIPKKEEVKPREIQVEVKE
jgi:HSP20 family protein